MRWLQHLKVPFPTREPDSSKQRECNDTRGPECCQPCVLPSSCCARCRVPLSPALLLDVPFPGPPRWQETMLRLPVTAAVTDWGTLQLSP